MEIALLHHALSNDNPRHLGNSCVLCNLQGNILTVCRYNFCPALLCQTNMLLQPCQILRCFFCFFCCLHIQCRKAGLKRLCHLRRSPNNFFIGWRRGQTHQDMLFFCFSFSNCLTPPPIVDHKRRESYSQEIFFSPVPCSCFLFSVKFCPVSGSSLLFSVKNVSI